MAVLGDLVDYMMCWMIRVLYSDIKLTI